MLLLLANLGLLAMQGGWLAAWIGRPAADAQREPARLARQINPAGLTLLPAAGVGSAGASATAAAMPAASASAAASR